MSMAGTVQNTVVSMVVMALMAGVHPCVGMTASPHLTSYPEAARDGADFTLSCTPAQGRTSISVRWYRNNVNIFGTSTDADISAAILFPLTTSPEYQSVSGRISVSSSPQEFNVTLRTNPTLDQGSVWTCQTGPQFSNNLTIEVKESIQVSISVYATKDPGTDDQILKLTCEGTDNITETIWSRNSVNIFQTTLPRSMLVYNTDSPEYQSVSGRISVSSSLQQHNVTLRTNSTLDQGSVWRCQAGQQFSNNITVEFEDSIQAFTYNMVLKLDAEYSNETFTNSLYHVSSSLQQHNVTLRTNSTLDQGSVWRCQSGQHFSNNITIEVKESIQGTSSPGSKSTTEGHTGPSSTDDKATDPTVSTQTPFIHTVGFIYVVAGSAGVVVIVIVIVIVVLLWTRSRREDKTEKDNCKEGAYNEESEREAIVMEDNGLYHGFVRTENQESAEEQQVAAASKVSSSQNADVNTPD